MTDQPPPPYLTDKDFAALPLPLQSGSFTGKRVLVTGGGSGVGKATAWLLARLGARVLIVGRTEQKLADTVTAMRAGALEVDYQRLDIRDYDAVQALFASCAGSGDPVDVLINNAGGQFAQAAIDFSANGWNSVINNNLNGTWYMMQHAARHWRDSGRGGNIVNIVAVVNRGMAGGAHTCAARAGVIHVSKTVAIEWAEYGIRVNCIAPGILHTEGMEVYSEAARREFTCSNPMLRFGSPWDVAQACAFLAGDSANFITGEVLTIDGGGQLWGELWMNGRPDYFKRGE